MLGSHPLVGFVGVSDVERARAFYGDVLGLRLTSEWPGGCVFDAGGTTLRVTLVDAPAGAGYTVLGWTVGDIAAVVGELGGRGVAFERYEGLPQDELGVWQTPDGSRVAWFKDPDANVLSVTQLVAT